MIYLGLDPGASGGIAAIDGYEHVVRAWAMPDSERGVWELVSELARMQGEKRAVIEKLQPMPAKLRGGIGNFHLGGSYSFLRACLHATAIPFEAVLPRRWQADMRCANTKKLKSPQHKKAMCAVAEELFPSVDVTLKNCDALLLAEWLRRRENGGGK